MQSRQSNNPLHGVTLEAIVSQLVERYGWDELAERIPIHCFQNEPSLRSSLKFLRRMPWARSKVEALYLAELGKERAEPPPRDEAKRTASRVSEEE